MNLDAIKKAIKTTEREVEFKPAGIATGWIFSLRHESAPEVQAVLKKYNAKVRDAAMKRKNSRTKAILEEHEQALRIAHVSGWKWKEGDDAAKNRPPFSQKELIEILEQKDIGWHLKTFIDEEITGLEDFLERQGNN